jgi:RNA polymerase sigma factor (sigma-70 family)
MTEPAVCGDEELVSASLRGDREAFGQIVRRHQALVCSLAYSGTGNLTQSEDLAQETFITAWKQLAHLREPTKLRYWLCGIARNLINNFLRTQGREPSHRAEALEDIAEQRSPEPLPAERAISREEADILWRALERIPETYREPLVLFYREHQSVEAVAQALELTEDAVRQRLTRGRKLLQEEVLAFVEGALAKTGPGTGFSLGVLAALPLTVTSAQAASIGVAVVKGGAGAKSAFSLTALGSLAGMLGAVLFSWKNAVDETKSQPERRLMVRTAWFQIAFFSISLGATFYGLPRLAQYPLVFGLGLALLLFANLVNGVVLMHHVGRKRTQIMLEEGTWADAEWSEPGKEADRKAVWKTAKLMIPFALLFVVGTIGLPWKAHPIRSTFVVAGEVVILLYAFRRFRALLSGQLVMGSKAGWMPAFLRHPIILLPVIILGSVLLGPVLVLFLNPDGAKALMEDGSWLRNIALWVLAAMTAYVIFVVILVKKRFIVLGADDPSNQTEGPFPEPAGGNSAMRILGLPMFNKTLALTSKMMAPMMGKLMVKSYAPVLRQIDLNPEQRAQLEELLLKKNAVNMDQGLALMNRKLDAAGRAAAIEQMKSAREGCDAEIRQLLGEQNYIVFEQFEKTIPDRLVIGIFRGKVARLGAALSPDGEEQLIAAITQARALRNWSTDLSRRNQAPADPVAMFSEANINLFAREEEEFESEFLAEARSLLTPVQFAEFEPFQAKQRQAKIASMRMTAKMFRPKG